METGKSILIVDDNPGNLQVLGTFLRNGGYRVEFATEGNAALDWIFSGGIELVLLDIKMPGMDGFEVCSRIRSDSRFNDIPILFITAETGKESVLRGFEIGGQDYVTKPFDNRELLARVNTHLETVRCRKELKILNGQLDREVRDRTQKLEKANSDLEHANMRLLEFNLRKGEFLNLISHEIRTPLNGILGSIHLIKQKMDLSNVGALLNILDQSVSRLERFSLNALLITNLRITQNEMNMSDLELEEIVRECIGELSAEAKDKSVRIHFDRGLVSSSILGNHDLLKKCISNILDNAVHHSPPGDAISIGIRRNHRNLVCEISDNGRGFMEDILANPFELFSLYEKKADSKLGLGLYLSKLIMEAHSGEIEVGNHSGGGARVKLTFKWKN